MIESGTLYSLQSRCQKTLQLGTLNSLAHSLTGCSNRANKVLVLRNLRGTQIQSGMACPEESTASNSDRVDKVWMHYSSRCYTTHRHRSTSK